MAVQSHGKSRVSYYYDSDIGNYYYGQGHPMKPHRIRMTHNLLIQYGLYRKMEVHRPIPASFEEMTRFHADDYMTFLKNIRQDNIAEYSKQMQRFNVGEDCPVFDGVFEFCQLSCGGSIAAAQKLNRKQADICINWMGGLHHAKKSEASGFCYSNDIVLAILELLKTHQRVLYVDIDIHHGDGVEEAFYTTDRVMTVSFHKYGEYFPGTGDMKDIGVGAGKNYSVNFPLRDGIDDDTYQFIFEPVMQKVMEMFQPEAIVLQCGADSLSGDRLGCFNLTLKGHGHCVDFLKKYGVPLLLVGGGGYTIRNVSRCWTYETSVALDTEISNDLPFNDYFEYFGPEYKLHITPSNMSNLNTKEYLTKHATTIYENLRGIIHAPSVGMQPIPPPTFPEPDVSALIDAADPDERMPEAVADSMVEDMGEFFDNDADNGRNIQSHKRSASSPPRSQESSKIPRIEEIVIEDDEEEENDDDIEEVAVAHEAIEDEIIEEQAIDEDQSIEEARIDALASENPTIEEDTIEDEEGEDEEIDEEEDEGIEEEVAKDQAIEKPVTQETVVQESAMEEPSIEETMQEEQRMDVPVLVEQAVEESLLEPTVLPRPVAKEPRVEDPTAAIDPPVVEERLEE